MTGLARLGRDASPTLRLLTVNQFGINVGFYMLIPYLAGYLSGPLGLPAATVGLILGVRNLGQQGMFAVGGALADRCGYRPLIVAGCLLRVAAFGLLAVAHSVGLLVAACLLTGLAGALFNPAVRAYVAAESPHATSAGFALFNAGYQGGILAGPLLGLAVTAVDFRLAAVCAAGVFAVLTAAQLRWLPASPTVPAPAAGMWAGFAEAAANRSFRRFAGWMGLSYVLSFQVYLAIPLALRAAVGAGAATAVTAAVFAGCGLLAVVGQATVHRWCARLPPQVPPALGVSVMAGAFLPPALAAGCGGPVAAAAAAIAALALTAGTLIAYPFEMQTIIALSRGTLTGTYYGLYQTVAGVAIAAGTWATGRGWDAAAAAGLPALPWLGLATLGALAAFGLAAQRRATPPPQRRSLHPRPTAERAADVAASS